MHVLQLEPGPLPGDLADSLRHKSVVCLKPSGPGYEALRAAGIEPTIARSGEVPDGATLLLERSPLDHLAHIVDRLLGPGGCPWDREQTHESLKKYLLEEAYEVLDAIDSRSSEKLREELGDLLLQPLMHAQMKQRDGEFGTDDVAREISEKLVRRHPHVFGETNVADADEVLRNWDRIKKAEKGEPRSILSGVPVGMASLLRAHEISKRAARVGFEWPNIDSVFDKLDEEIAELKEALASGDRDGSEAEMGDLLFTAVNVARWAGIEPEEALRKMLNRFTARFMSMEQSASGELADLSAEDWDSLWNQAKQSTSG